MEINMDNLTKQLIEFRNERDWEQFHNPKDMALALSIEAAELAELFLWKNENESIMVSRERIAEELADVFSFAFLLAEKFEFNVAEIVQNKIELNRKKYPIEKAKGKSDKYNQL